MPRRAFLPPQRFATLNAPLPWDALRYRAEVRPTTPRPFADGLLFPFGEGGATVQPDGVVGGDAARAQTKTQPPRLDGARLLR